MLRQYAGAFIKARSTKAVFLIMAAEWLIGLISPGVLFNGFLPRKYPQFIQANCWGFFSMYSTTFITVPIFCILFQHNRRFFDNSYILARTQSFRRYFLYRLSAIGFECMTYLLFLYLLIVARQIVYRPSQFVGYGIPLLATLLLQFTGLFSLALINCFFSAVFKNGIAGMLVCICFAVNDFMRCYFQIGFMTFVAPSMYYYHLKELSNLSIFLPQLAYMAILNTVLAAASGLILSTRDRLS